MYLFENILIYEFKLNLKIGSEYKTANFKTKLKLSILPALKLVSPYKYFSTFIRRKKRCNVHDLAVIND